MVFIGGVGLGIFLYGEGYPLIEKFAYSTDMGQVTLPGYFNLHYGLVVFGVVLMALGGFWAAGKAEKFFGGKAKV